MKLVTKDILKTLIANGEQTQQFAGTPQEPDHTPVVKFFDPYGAATWLITSTYRDDPDVLFGLCDLGMGFPELGDVRLSELSGLKTSFGGPRIERDRNFTAKHPLSVYTEVARRERRIVSNLPRD